MHRLTLLGLAVAAMSLGSARRAAAQNEDLFALGSDKTTGLLLNVHVGYGPGVKITDRQANAGTTFETKAGPVAGLQVGWGFNPKLLVYATWDRLTMQGTNRAIFTGDAPLEHWEGGLRWNFRPEQEHWVPYANIGIGGRELHAAAIHPNSLRTGRIIMTGREYHLGGGTSYFYRETIAFTGDVQLGLGKFNKVKFTGARQFSTRTNNVATPRLAVGASWYYHPR